MDASDVVILVKFLMMVNQLLMLVMLFIYGSNVISRYRDILFIYYTYKIICYFHGTM